MVGSSAHTPPPRQKPEVRAGARARELRDAGEEPRVPTIPLPPDAEHLQHQRNDSNSDKLPRRHCSLSVFIRNRCRTRRGDGRN